MNPIWGLANPALVLAAAVIGGALVLLWFGSLSHDDAADMAARKAKRQAKEQKRRDIDDEYRETAGFK